MDEYKMIIEQILNDFENIGRSIGLDDIINKINKKKTKFKFIIINVQGPKGSINPITKDIFINREILDEYSKSSSNDLYSGKIGTYRTIFHELVHLSRELKNNYYLKKVIMSYASLIASGFLAGLSLYYSPYLLPISILLGYKGLKTFTGRKAKHYLEIFISSSGSLIISGFLASLFLHYSPYLLPISILLGYKGLKYLNKFLNYDRIEETITEAITIVLLSKKFGKEKIKKILEEDIISTWLDATPKYFDGKYIYYLYLADRKYLEYDLGRILGYLLLNVSEDKQKEYVRKLMDIYKRRNLKKLIYDLGHDIPEDEKMVNYYNLVKYFVEGKAKIYNQ